MKKPKIDYSGQQEYERFDRMMRQLVTVPHSEIKAKLDAEKAEKAKRQKGRRIKNDKRDENTH